MNWFQHDTAATQDAKVKKLLIRYGAIGYAVYFHCLELIASDISETNLTFELEHDSEIIAENLKIQGTGEKSGREIVDGIMRTIIELGLFNECEGHVFCFKLLKRINLSATSSQSFRKAITEARETYHDKIMTRHDNVMINHDAYTMGHEYQPTNNTNNTNQEEREERASPRETTHAHAREDQYLSGGEEKTFHVGNDGISRFAKAAKAWNDAGLDPKQRKLFNDIFPDERSAALSTFSWYEDEEVADAIQNYAKIRASPEHEIECPYRSLTGFLRAGVEKFVSSAKPFEMYRRKRAGPTEETETETSEQRRAAMLARIRATPEYQAGIAEEKRQEEERAKRQRVGA